MTVEIGTIIGWTNDTIPSGWALCDGSNGTPNLVSKFLRGAADDTALGSTGGATTHAHSMPDISADNHTHSNRTATSGYATRTDESNAGYNNSSMSRYYSHTHSVTVSFSSAGSHTHTIPNTANTDHTPPYFSLRFIQKIA